MNPPIYISYVHHTLYIFILSVQTWNKPNTKNWELFYNEFHEKCHLSNFYSVILPSFEFFNSFSLFWGVNQINQMKLVIFIFLLCGIGDNFVSFLMIFYLRFYWYWVLWGFWEGSGHLIFKSLDRMKKKAL